MTGSHVLKQVANQHLPKAHKTYRVTSWVRICLPPGLPFFLSAFFYSSLDLFPTGFLGFLKWQLLSLADFSTSSL